MLKKYITIVILMLCCASNFVLAQVSQLPTVIPPSPNAAELGKYGSLDVGLQTGSLNFTIPLFTVDGGQWKMPINLQYSTSGIRVDQISSRAGMGWAFNGGGVITRNVNGLPDERSTRTPLPATWNLFDQNSLNYLQSVTGSSSNDTQPDEFMYNFNGYSGKFIFDDNGSLVLMPHQNLKVNYVVNSPESSSIIITTPDGVTYYFSDVELTSVNSTCFGSFPGPTASRVPTAWYLSKVVLPNKEVVTLEYDNIYSQYDSGISQTLSRSYDIDNSSNCPTTSCPIFSSEGTCRTTITSFGKMLRKIKFRSLIASFNYISRQDMIVSDPSQSGEGLLSNIQLSSNGVLLNVFNLDYVYATPQASYASTYGTAAVLGVRPFLKSLTEGRTAPELKKHIFSYNDINGLPYRLSYAQDVFGYFNGFSNSNFVSIPDNPIDIQMFSRADANRSSNLGSTLKGALVSILYPTGGTDSVIYELNEYRGIKNLPAPRQTKALSILASPDEDVTVSSASFTAYSYLNTVVNGGTLIPIGGDGSSTVSPVVDLVRVEVIRNSTQASVFSRTLRLGQNLSNVTANLSPGESYYIKMTRLYPNIRCSFSIGYESGPPTTVPANLPIGGLRVAAVHTKNNTGNTQIRKFYYAYLDDFNKSSGSGPNPGIFAKNYNTIISGPCGIVQEGNPPGKIILTCKNRTAYSSSLNTVYRYSQNYVYYENVIEGLGDNFENGGTSHAYMVEPDRLSRPLWGPYLIFGLKTTNSGSKNGLELEQSVFKKQNDSFVILKKTVNTYKEDSAVNKIVQGYIITKYYDFVEHSNPPQGDEFNGYEINNYGFYSKWVYKNSSVSYDYNEGNAPVITKTDYQYNNPLNTSVSVETTENSDGSFKQVNYKYPHDMVSLGRDVNGIYQGMIGVNIITPVIEQTVSRNGKTSQSRTNYIQPFPGIYVPGTVDVRNAVTGLDETRVRYHAYDKRGNPVSVSQESGVKISYIWSYGSQYPVAEIKGAEYPAIVAALGGQAQVDAFSAIMNPGATDIRNFIALVKTALPDAMVSTFTFSPLVGMSSQTDNKGMTTYYEYDEFQRLRSVKDQYGNIIKNNIYHYKN